MHKQCVVGVGENYGFMEVIPASSIIIFANRFVIFATRRGDENPISHCVGTVGGRGYKGNGWDQHGCGISG